MTSHQTYPDLSPQTQCLQMSKLDGPLSKISSGFTLGKDDVLVVINTPENVLRSL